MARRVGPRPTARVAGVIVTATVRDAPQAVSLASPRSALLIVAFASIGVFVGLFGAAGFAGWFVDALTYLASGERLNSGGLLYHLSPGDRPIAIIPPFWHHPTLQPPLIAVLWRPMALLGDIALPLWSVANAVAVVWVILLVFRRHGQLGALLVLILSPALGATIAVGNINGFALAGMAVAWDHPRLRGPLLAFMIAVKLQLALLLPWLLGTRDWRAVGQLVVTGVLLTLVSIAGAGLDAHLEYPSVLGATSAQPWSLAFQTGLPWIHVAIAVVGSVVALALYRRPAASFRMAVVTMVFGTAAFGPVTAALLLAIGIPGGEPVAEAPITTPAAAAGVA